MAASTSSCAAIKIVKNGKLVGWQWGPPPRQATLLELAEKAKAAAEQATSNVRRRQREWERRRHGLVREHRTRQHPPGWRPPSTTNARRPLPGLGDDWGVYRN